MIELQAALKKDTLSIGHHCRTHAGRTITQISLNLLNNKNEHGAKRDTVSAKPFLLFLLPSGFHRQDKQCLTYSCR